MIKTWSMSHWTASTKVNALSISGSVPSASSGQVTKQGNYFTSLSVLCLIDSVNLVSTLQGVPRYKSFMMPRTKVTSETYLRELPYRTILELARQLDSPNGLNRNWKGVASRVQSKRGGDRYDLAVINMFEMELQKGRSPTMALINDWGTSNATVQDLVNILEELDMLSTIDILLPDYNSSKARVKEETILQHGAEYTSFTPHKEKATATLPSMSSAASITSSAGAEGSWSIKEDEISSSTDRKEPCESCIQPMEQSSLPSIPHENDQVREYKYQDLYEMTDRFNDKPISEGGFKIGEGGFGTVFKGFFAGNQVCAIKRLKKEMLSDEKLVKQFTAEHTTLTKLQHHNLVRLYGYSFNGPSLCLVFEYLINGSLNARLACEDGTQPLQWRTRVRIAQGAAQGICYLHENGQVHRDIKSANILLDENNIAKVGDFGLVKAMPEGDSRTMATTQVIGSQVYMAPEAQFGQISPKCDAYSFGVVLLEIMTGWPVLNDEWENPDLITHIDFITEETDFIKLMDKKMEHNFGEDSVRKMYAISTRLLETKKQKRPELSKVLEEIMQL